MSLQEILSNYAQKRPGSSPRNTEQVLAQDNRKIQRKNDLFIYEVKRTKGLRTHR